MRQFNKGMINVSCKVSSKEGHMIRSFDPEPDQILFSDPAPLKHTV